jgi:uncharacterized membrane protein YozB (DUF420 family)
MYTAAKVAILFLLAPLFTVSIHRKTAGQKQGVITRSALICSIIF